MKALVKARPEKGIWMQDQPVPEIGPDDVLVKVHKTGICGTDVHIYNWDEWARKTVPVPMVTGSRPDNFRGGTWASAISRNAHLVGGYR